MSLSGGDYWNLAGTFVFSKEGETLYELRQKSFADAPGIEELMQACRRAAGMYQRCDPADKVCSSVHIHAVVLTRLLLQGTSDT